MNLFEPKVAAVCPRCQEPGGTPLAPIVRASYGNGGVDTRKDGHVLGCCKCGLRYCVTARGVWAAPLFQMAGTPPPAERKADSGAPDKPQRPPHPTLPDDMNAREPRV